jgi:hypothetical protein
MENGCSEYGLFGEWTFGEKSACPIISYVAVFNFILEG